MYAFIAKDHNIGVLTNVDTAHSVDGYSGSVERAIVRLS